MLRNDKENTVGSPHGLSGDEDRLSSQVTASRCRKCGRAFFPPRVICPDCFADDTLEAILLARRGVIYSLSIVRVPPPSGRAVPYAVGYVDLPEQGLRVFTRFANCNLEELELGTEVEMIADVEKSMGGDVPGYVFRPVA